MLSARNGNSRPVVVAFIVLLSLTLQLASYLKLILAKALPVDVTIL